MLLDLTTLLDFDIDGGYLKEEKELKKKLKLQKIRSKASHPLFRCTFIFSLIALFSFIIPRLELSVSLGIKTNQAKSQNKKNRKGRHLNSVKPETGFIQISC